MILRRLIALFFSLLVTPLVVADISDFSVSNYSKYKSEVDTGSKPLVFGGFGGASCSTSSVCNSCQALEGLTAGTCNEYRVDNTLELKFTFTPTTSGPLLITKSDGTTTLTLGAGSNTTATGGSSVTVSASWNAICKALADSTITNCEDQAVISGSLRVGVSNTSSDQLGSDDDYVSVDIRAVTPTPTPAICANNVKGVCNIGISAGDEKIRFPTVATKNAEQVDFLIDADIEIEYLRVWYSITSLTDAYFSNKDSASPQYEDILIRDKTDLSTEILNGFDNEIPVAVVFGNVDSAGNINYVSDLTDVATNPGCGSFTTGTNLSNPAFAADVLACPYTTTPSKVGGMLGDKACFIATAAYGTSMNDQLKSFRSFRDTILLQNPWGTKFVRWYYKYGPIGAKAIQESEILKGATRLLLQPLYMFSSLSLKFGFTRAFLMSLLSLSLLLFGLVKLQRRLFV